MKFLKLVKVTSSANDDNVMQVVNVDKIEVIVTTGDTCVINYKGDGVTGAVKTTITSAGRGNASCTCVPCWCNCRYVSN